MPKIDYSRSVTILASVTSREGDFIMERTVLCKAVPRKNQQWYWKRVKTYQKRTWQFETAPPDDLIGTFVMWHEIRAMILGWTHRSEDVRRLFERGEHKGDTSALAPLADALQEAGFPHDHDLLKILPSMSIPI